MITINRNQNLEDGHLTVGDSLDYISWSGKIVPLWVGPFPKPDFLDCVSGERARACSLCSLLLDCGCDATSRSRLLDFPAGTDCTLHCELKINPLVLKVFRSKYFITATGRETRTAPAEGRTSPVRKQGRTGTSMHYWWKSKILHAAILENECLRYTLDDKQSCHLTQHFQWWVYTQGIWYHTWARRGCTRHNPSTQEMKAQSVHPQSHMKLETRLSYARS